MMIEPHVRPGSQTNSKVALNSWPDVRHAPGGGMRRVVYHLAIYAGSTELQNGTVPAEFTASITPIGAPTEGQPYYLRAMALVEDSTGEEIEVWSDEVIVYAHVEA